GHVYVTYGSTGLNRSQDVYVASFDQRIRPILGVRLLKPVSSTEGIHGPDQFLPTSTLDPETGRIWACYYQSLGRARKVARYVCTASDDGGEHWKTPRVVSRAVSDETIKRAERADGYGDYEGIAATAGV